MGLTNVRGKCALLPKEKEVKNWELIIVEKAEENNNSQEEEEDMSELGRDGAQVGTVLKHEAHRTHS